MSFNGRPKTIFCDIDGVLFKHNGDILRQPIDPPEVLPGVVEKFQDWDRKGYRIYLVTGRRESMREQTEAQLKSIGIFYDMLIMGVGGGLRVIINDRKPNGSDDTAMAINLIRNQGLEGVEI